MSVSLDSVGTLFGGTQPHGLSELYGKQFEGGGSSPAQGQSINLYGFSGKQPLTTPTTPPGSTQTSFTYGSYSTTNLIPPILTATSQNGYTVSGHASISSDILFAFNRSASDNYRGASYPFSNNIYTGPSKSWSGVATYTAPWIIVQLPASQSIKGYVIRPEATTNLGQKPRILGSNDGNNWNLLWYTDTLLNNPTGTRNNMNPVVIIFGSPTISYTYYAYIWLENQVVTADYLPRVAQLNFII